jgi:hypothetical protein
VIAPAVRARCADTSGQQEVQFAQLVTSLKQDFIRAEAHEVGRLIQGGRVSTATPLSGGSDCNISRPGFMPLTHRLAPAI